MKQMKQVHNKINKNLKINEVKLDNCQINDDDIEYIAGHYNADACQKVSLNFNAIKDVGLLNYSKSNWNSVRVLRIGDNFIGSKGCKYLIRTELQRLQFLDIGGNMIQSVGMQYLSQSQWNLLQQIYLSDNNISQRGIQNLIKSKWKRLNILQMNWNYIDYSQMIKMLLLETDSIKMLDLRNNEIIDDNKAMILDLIRKKFTYQKLLSYC